MLVHPRHQVLALLAALGGCPEPADKSTPDTTPTVGVEPDGDGDGVEAPEDCDDTDADVFPGALEHLGDAVDGDCDGDADRTAATRVEDLVATGIHGVDLGVDTDDVWIAVNADGYDSPQGTVADAFWLGKYNSSRGDFRRDFWYGDSGRAWTTGVDLHVDDTVLAWALGYLEGDERNVLVEVLPQGSADQGGVRVVARTATTFDDVDLLALEDGTLMVAGCDPARGELVVIHGTPAELAVAEGYWGYGYAVPTKACAVGALSGAMIVADAANDVFDLYTWSDAEGLSFFFSLAGYAGHDLDTLQLDGAIYQADAEGPAGARLVSPTGEVWWTGSEAWRMDVDGSDPEHLLLAVLDENGAPWLLWGGGATGLTGAWLGGTLPSGHDVAVTRTPAGEVFVAVAEDDGITWARFGVP